MRTTATSRAIFACALALALAGCTVGPRYSKPSVPSTPGYGEALPAGWKEAQPSDGTLRGNWWEMYQDPQLNRLEEQVVISNQNVLAAEAQYREARAAVRAARSALFPTLGAAISVTGSRTAQGSTLAPGGVRGFYSLPLDATYQTDVWGGIRGTVAASAAQAQATAAQLENAKLLYRSELAADYFQLRGLDNDLALLEETVTSYEKFLQLTKDRYASGIASMGDVAQAQTQLETARAQLTDVGIERAQLTHAIAVLAGKPPAELSIAPAPGTFPLPAVPLGVPSALLERRPDIAALERQAKAANEQIGVARAALFPAITLSASGGTESAEFLKLLSGPSYLWSLGDQLAQTLFDNGKRRAQIAINQAEYDRVVANYRQSVLAAFQEVEDGLAALRILAEEAEIQARAVAAAQESLKISTAQYEGGVQSYLQVITTQTIQLQNQRAAVQIETRRMVAHVMLVQALGGGWDTSQLPRI